MTIQIELSARELDQVLHALLMYRCGLLTKTYPDLEYHTSYVELYDKLHTYEVARRAAGMTKAQAEFLASNDRYYRARFMNGQWVIWDDMSDHVVEFQLGSASQEAFDALA